MCSKTALKTQTKLYFQMRGYYRYFSSIVSEMFSIFTYIKIGTYRYRYKNVLL